MKKRYGSDIASDIPRIHFLAAATLDPGLSYKYEFVLRSMSLYYGVPVCITEFQLVLQTVSLYYGEPVCTSEYQFVLRSMSLYCGVPVCTTEYQFVLRSLLAALQVAALEQEFQFPQASSENERKPMTCANLHLRNRLARKAIWYIPKEVWFSITQQF